MLSIMAKDEYFIKKDPEFIEKDPDMTIPSLLVASDIGDKLVSGYWRRRMFIPSTTDTKTATLVEQTAGNKHPQAFFGL